MSFISSPHTVALKTKFFFSIWDKTSKSKIVDTQQQTVVSQCWGAHFLSHCWIKFSSRMIWWWESFRCMKFGMCAHRVKYSEWFCMEPQTKPEPEQVEKRIRYYFIFSLKICVDVLDTCSGFPYETTSRIEILPQCGTFCYHYNNPTKIFYIVQLILDLAI